jgi:hypothetical protein
MYEIRHETLVFAQNLQKIGLYVKIYAHRLEECTIQPISFYIILIYTMV